MDRPDYTNLTPHMQNSQVSIDDATQPQSVGVRVLAVTSRASVRRRLSSMLRGHTESMVFADDQESAIESVSTSHFDLVIIERALKGCDGIHLLEQVTSTHPAIVGVIVGQIENTEDAVRAMRAGAGDIVSIQNRNAQATKQLIASVKKAQRIRERDARVDRLKKLCHKLNSARQEVSGQVGELCSDLVTAYQDLSDQFGDVKIATELNVLLRQELEIESLLRTMLEFTLSKIGSTNAVVFLPTNTGDYSLGAYVNYDIPRDGIEIMLDQLADCIAPQFEDQDTVLALNGYQEMEEVLGRDAHWLDASSALVVSCVSDGECLAVISLFRDESNPFTDADIKSLSIIAKLFGDQLARVIHVHHRHLPKDQWGTLDSYDDGPIDDDEDFFSSGDDHYGFAA